MLDNKRWWKVLFSPLITAWFLTFNSGPPPLGSLCNMRHHPYNSAGIAIRLRVGRPRNRGSIPIMDEMFLFSKAPRSSLEAAFYPMVDMFHIPVCKEAGAWSLSPIYFCY
jgi:hypothetical protein